jgi:hypothetical protein
MTTNMKAATLMDLPMLATDNEIKTTAPTRQPRIGWLIPCVLLLAAVIAFQAFSTLAEISSSLDGVEAYMHSPQR